jgi:hypothetical protein
MSSNGVRRSCAILLLLAVSAALASAQATDKAALPEMWTAIQGKLDASHLKVGDTLQAKVLQGWVYQSCGVAEDAVLKGTVSAVNPWKDSSRATELTVSFEAECVNGARQPLVLMAVFYPLEADKSQMEVFKEMPAGIGAGSSGRQSTDIGRLPAPGDAPRPAMPLAGFGEVKRVAHLTLEVAKGPGGSTTLHSTDKKIKLDDHTRLVLVPVPAAK